MASVSAMTVLTDTGFWYALYDQRDEFHEQAVAKEAILASSTILLPWPVLYETFNTRFAKNKWACKSFENLLSAPRVVLLADDDYRQDALDLAFRNISSRSMALVDVVIRLIPDDVKVRKNGLPTFNPGGFSDLCRKRYVEIL